MCLSRCQRRTVRQALPPAPVADALVSVDLLHCAEDTGVTRLVWWLLLVLFQAIFYMQPLLNLP